MVNDKAWRVVALFAAMILVALAFDYGPSLWASLADSDDPVRRSWEWLTGSEDLGKRLRRECESVVREAHPTAEDIAREAYIRYCIESRARFVR